MNNCKKIGIEAIKDYLNDICLPSFTSESAQTSILKICGIERNENAWSDIYAYFLNPYADHGLGSLFLNSLLALANKGGRKTNYEMRDVRIFREYKTEDDNRIDILIMASESTVIIENKIYHSINNPFEKYWKAINAENKIGVLLTLSPLKSPDPNFINITHHDWLHAVKCNLPEKMTSKTQILYNDFLMTIDKLSNIITNEEKRLYLSNRNKINALVDISTRYKDWLQAILRDKSFVSELSFNSWTSGCHSENLSIVHDDRTNSVHRYVMYKIPGTDELVFTIYYEPLWKSDCETPHLLVLLEPLGNWYHSLEKNTKKWYRVANCAKDNYVPGNTPKAGERFWHCAADCAYFDLNVLTAEQLHNKLKEMLAPQSPLMRTAEEVIKIMAGSDVSD